MNHFKEILIIALSLLFLSSCKEKPIAPNEMKDAAGNIYKTVTIGNQVWMAENLRALYINMPNSIGEGSVNAIEAYCWFPDYNPATMANYGLLYTFEGAEDLLPRGGWRIPTLLDFTILLSELGINLENGSVAVVNELKINDYPGSNDDEIFTIDKYFSLLLDQPATSMALDYQTIRIHARDYPDDEIYRRELYLYNVTKNFASSVRFVKNIE